jgi:hypothetical protein
MEKTYCYWTVADRTHGMMAATMVASARALGVTADFHVWTDLPTIPGAIVHPSGHFSKHMYMFKFDFLKNEVSKLNYDYYVFLDADTYFTKNPGNIVDIMGEDKVYIQLQNECIPSKSLRTNWWSCPIGKYCDMLKEYGVKSDTYYDVNAGLFVVSRLFVDEVYDIATRFHSDGHKRGYHRFTEEPSLALIGHLMQDISKRNFEQTSWLWASDWNGYWHDRLPEYKEWEYTDWMNGGIKIVKPCIVHCLKSKLAMIKEYQNKLAP